MKLLNVFYLSIQRIDLVDNSIGKKEGILAFLLIGLKIFNTIV